MYDYYGAAGSSAILRFSSNQIIKIPINTGFPILVNDKIRMFAEEPQTPDRWLKGCRYNQVDNSVLKKLI